MTLESWVVAGAAIIVLVIAGGTIGVMAFALLLQARANSATQRALTEQQEAHRVELRDMADYNSRLERRVTELEAQLTLMVEVLQKSGIRVPKTGPLISASEVNIGGSVTGRDSG